MLKQRVITASILIPLVVWGIFSLPTFPVFASIIGLIVLLGAQEWIRLINLKPKQQQRTYLLVIIALLLASYTLMQNALVFNLLLFASVVWWTLQILNLSSYDGEQGFDQSSSLGNLWTGSILLVPTWASLMFLHQQPEIGPGLLLLLLLLIWAADSGAYFAGRKYGKNKLAPLVSPGKTKEGAYGAFAASAIVALIGGFWLDLGFFQLVSFLLLSFIVVIYSIGGDLLESVYKRRAGVKDSGALLPGHGGVLDRIDSLMSAAPIFTFGIWLLGLI
ncbi:MAG TPA: phosphatidate cytidylyltransferase [Gammaproteobacteria bacterium]|nr:phosphatidate cytidylyltransferase [Gammaproteobacteria bacterium]